MDITSIDKELIAALIQIGKSISSSSCGEPEPRLLSDRADGVVVRVGDVVVKAHPPGADATALAARLRVAASLAPRNILLPPLRIPRGEAISEYLSASPDGRLVTVWPFGEPVSPDAPEAAPWEQAAFLLARLHATPLHALPEPEALPPAGGPGRVARALERLRIADGTPAAAGVREAADGLPAWAKGEAPAPRRSAALVHGDWHLGQMVRLAGPRAEDTRKAGTVSGWRLIDVDDLGVGDPAWDLARPAAWYAAGLMSPEVWMRFLSAYRAAGGCAVPADGDPWPALDVPARALTVQTAALAVAAAAREGRPLDEVEEAFVDACRRIARISNRSGIP